MNNFYGWETREIENQPRLKIINLNLTLTCNRYILELHNTDYLPVKKWINLLFLFYFLILFKKNDYQHSVAQCLQLMLRLHSYREAFFKLDGVQRCVYLTDNYLFLVKLRRTYIYCEDDYHTSCQMVSHCQQQQSYSGLRSPGRWNSTYFWNIYCCYTAEILFSSVYLTISFFTISLFLLVVTN